MSTRNRMLPPRARAEVVLLRKDPQLPQKGRCEVPSAVQCLSSLRTGRPEEATSQRTSLVRHCTHHRQFQQLTPKPPNYPPPLPMKRAPISPPPLPAPAQPPTAGLSPPPKRQPMMATAPKVPPNSASGIPVHTRPADFNLTPKPPPLANLYNRLQPSVKRKGKGKQQGHFREGPYEARPWHLRNVPPPPLPSGAPSSSSSSHAPVTGQPTVRGTDERPLEPFDFPGVQWQRTDPWADNYWPNHMELRQWMEQGWQDDTERFGYRHY